MTAHNVLAVGEVLWDSLPEGLFLGGATFNVCCHLRSLGHTGVLLSSVGDDVLGEEVKRRMQMVDMPSFALGVVPDQPTGRVIVELDSSGVPTYDILAPAAWDFIEFGGEAARFLQEAEVVVFGSLAQRSEKSRAAIRSAWKASALKCFDVNLRPPYDDREVVLESLAAADFVKANDDELRQLSDWIGLTATTAPEMLDGLCGQFNIATFCVTRGGRGALLRNGGEIFEHPGYDVVVADTVGAGDAFLAGFLDAYFRGEPPPEWLAWGNRCGAYVATARGATPPLERARVAEIA